MFASISEILKACRKRGLAVWQLMLEQELERNEMTEEELYRDMEAKLQVMENAVQRGRKGVRSYSGMSENGALRMSEYAKSGRSITEGTFIEAITNAVAVNEVNASMGIICATPTAGSAGVLPAVLLACRDRLNLSREDQIRFLLTAGAFGLVIGNEASISGAEGGCQAEVGSASAMAAAALVWAAGGTPEQSAAALGIALMNVLGLVCDPVAGLVEIPCIKRNAMGAANALAAAEIALAGVPCEIPADEVIESMGRVGRLMPAALRETALGGVAASRTGRKIAKALKSKKKALMADGEE